MSGSTAFTDSEKVAVRRFCGYPAYGAGNSGFQGWRFYQAYGLLEYRMNNLSSAELATVRTYLSQLSTLEAAIPATSANLDTAQASVWKHSPTELSDRIRLFDSWRRRLCGFLGLPPGPDLAGERTLARVV